MCHTHLTLELRELELYLDWCHSLLMIYPYEKNKGYFPFYPHSLDNQYIQSHQSAKVLEEILQHLNLYFDYTQQAQGWSQPRQSEIVTQTPFLSPIR